MNRLQRVKDSIERRRDFTEARRILDSAPDSLLSGDQFVTERSTRDMDEDFTLISRDRGNGRASSGIRFLELVSVSFAGKNLDSMIKFDTVPVYVNLRAFYSPEISDTEKARIIARSLGVQEFMGILRAQRSPLFEEANERFVSVFKDVTNGIFRVNNSRQLLAFCRLLARQTFAVQRENRIRGASI